MQRQMFRQGDVLIVEVDALPARAKPAGHNTLAEGEVTGHSHQLIGGALFATPVTEPTPITGDVLLGIRVSEAGAKVVHEEHDTIDLPAGIYEVRRQREYSPEAIRQVLD